MGKKSKPLSMWVAVAIGLVLSMTVPQTGYFNDVSASSLGGNSSYITGGDSYESTLGSSASDNSVSAVSTIETETESDVSSGGSTNQELAGYQETGYTSETLESSSGACGGYCGESFVDYSMAEWTTSPSEVGSSSPSEVGSSDQGYVVPDDETTLPPSPSPSSTSTSAGSGSMANDSSTSSNDLIIDSSDTLASEVVASEDVPSDSPNGVPSSPSPQVVVASNETSIDTDASSSESTPTNQSILETSGSESALSSVTGNSSLIRSNEITDSQPTPSANDLLSSSVGIAGGEDNTLELEAAAVSSDVNTVTQPVTPGDGQGISYGDVSNTENVSATVSFDKNSYAIGDTVQITIEDGDGNIDPNTVNTITTVIRSGSDQTGIIVTLTETGPNTGQFVGTFQLTSSASTETSIKVDPSKGDNIQLLYDSSHPRAKATLDGVSAPGTVHLKETKVQTIPQGDFSEVLVGNAVELSLADGAELAPNEATDFCLTQFAQPVTTCGGHIALTLSYANAPLNNQQPSQLTIFQKVGGTWLNLKDFGEVIVDENAKTVSVITPFGPGIFTIGASIGGGGGGGGGIGLPGAGIVLDFLAPVTAPTPTPTPTPDPGTGPSTGGAEEAEEGSLVGTTTDTSDSSNTTEAVAGSNSALTSPSGSLAGGLPSGSAGKNSAVKTGNVTIVVPGEGFVLLSYQKLLSEGNLTVTPIKNISDVVALDIAKRSPEDQGTLTTSDDTKYGIVGTIFKIGPSDARFNETITISIPYDSVLAAGKNGDDIRILQYTGSAWADVTVLPSADGHSVTGSISSLGPVVAAVKSG